MVWPHPVLHFALPARGVRAPAEDQFGLTCIGAPRDVIGGLDLPRTVRPKMLDRRGVLP